MPSNKNGLPSPPQNLSTDYITEAHLYQAYRKAKVDTYYERELSLSFEFVEYEEDLNACTDSKVVIGLHPSRSNRYPMVLKYILREGNYPYLKGKTNNMTPKHILILSFICWRQSAIKLAA